VNVGYLDTSETFDIVPSNRYVSELRRCDSDDNCRKRDAVRVGYLDSE